MGSEVFITRKGGGGKAASPTITILETGATWVSFEITNGDTAKVATVYVMVDYVEADWEDDFDLVAAQQGEVISIDPGATQGPFTVQGLDPSVSHTLFAQAAVIKKLPSSIVETDPFTMTGTAPVAPTFATSVNRNTFYEMDIYITNNEPIPVTLQYGSNTSTTEDTSLTLELAASEVKLLTIPVTQTVSNYFFGKILDGTYSSSTTTSNAFTAATMGNPTIVSYTFGGTYFALTVKNNEVVDTGTTLDIYYNNNNSFDTGDYVFSDVAAQGTGGPTNTVWTTDHTVYVKAYHAASGQWSSGVASTTVEVPLFAFTSHTFTNCNATGIIGPTLSACISAYATTWDSNAAYFTQGRAQGYQVWTVPATAVYQITAAGARGQYHTSQPSNYNYGAVMRGRISLTKGQKLEMVVGQMGGTNSSYSTTEAAAGGGGGTFVVYQGTTNPVIVAGGGAGMYSSNTGQAWIHSGQSNTRPRWTGYNYNTATDGTTPNISYGGYGYHAGGGGGILQGGTGYPNYSYTTAASSSNGYYAYTHGSGFNGSNQWGTYYMLGGGYSGYSSTMGGFGGGGGGHSGNNSGGGGGGYTGGLGGNTSVGGSYLSGTGGGSFLHSTMTYPGSCDGKYNGATTYNGYSITNLGYNSGHGYVTIQKL